MADGGGVWQHVQRALKDIETCAVAELMQYSLQRGYRRVGVAGFKPGHGGLRGIRAPGQFGLRPPLEEAQALDVPTGLGGQ